MIGWLLLVGCIAIVVLPIIGVMTKDENIGDIWLLTLVLVLIEVFK